MNAPELIKTNAVKLRDFLMPPVCLACENRVETRGAVCPQCWECLRFVEKPWCAVTGTPFAYDLGANAKSAQAIAYPPAYDRARAVVLYDDTARQLVQSLKFGDRTDLAPWMAGWMVKALQRSDDSILESNPLVIPVPLHRRRLIARRFNQSAELARALAHQANLTYSFRPLERTRHTTQQVGLDKGERRSNVSGAFRVPVEQKPFIKGRNVLLIDDVHTTGATLNACARALRRGGAAQIDCMTFARVAPGDV